MSTLLDKEELNEHVKKDLKTLRTITKFEVARIIALRTSQLKEGCQPFIDISKLKDSDGYVDEQIIAELELKEKLIPMSIVRTLPNNKKDIIPVADLSLGK